MSCDLEMRDESGNIWSYDNIRTQSWLEGQRVGAEAFAGALTERAVELFRVGKDDEARKLRTMAAELLVTLKANMNKAADEHKKAFPEMVKPET